MAQNMGTIRRWNKQRGFGFIVCDDGGLDLFVHKNSVGIEFSTDKAVHDGLRVHVGEKKRTKKGWRARNVRSANLVRREERLAWEGSLAGRLKERLSDANVRLEGRIIKVYLHDSSVWGEIEISLLNTEVDIERFAALMRRRVELRLQLDAFLAQCTWKDAALLVNREAEGFVLSVYPTATQTFALGEDDPLAELQRVAAEILDPQVAAVSRVVEQLQSCDNIKLEVTALEVTYHRILPNRADTYSTAREEEFRQADARVGANAIWARFDGCETGVGRASLRVDPSDFDQFVASVVADCSAIEEGREE